VATKAERAKASAQVEQSKKRSANPRVASKRKQRSAETRDAAGSKYRTATTATRNRTRRTQPKASYALEGSENAKPSRKSTRGSSNRAKPDSNLRRRQMRRVRSPKARATRAAAAR
jgi:hypothetical protein